MPPLERRDHILPPVAHLRKRACKDLSHKTPIVAQGTVCTLRNFEGPGNAQDLANAIEHGAIVSTSGKLHVDIMTALVSDARNHSTLLKECDTGKMSAANLIACLQETGEKVPGQGSATANLRIRPTIHCSRI